jgi:hypothetical protein
VNVDRPVVEVLDSRGRPVGATVHDFRREAQSRTAYSGTQVARGTWSAVKTTAAIAVGVALLFWIGGRIR